MGRFRANSSSSGTPKISTASLPDIVFMLLFFFMIATTMKEVDFKVGVTMPEATELQKLEKKTLVRNIYVGKPLATFRAQYGTEPRIQLDDAFAEINQIENYVVSERSAMPEHEQDLLTICLKVDKDTKMGIVTDIKQALRRAYALKLNYAATQRANENL
ncbi:MAG: biopolymer transporter ExbD [Paludibacteraceae bacterium]|nr:biopolymer transporter ExbD [Paludibacteraceae bacterium]MBR2493343.1 biopolymer transporter ExbD [Paludibacteraceae bacterium]MBR3872021.1 biopolymer transporter ExbD [Paludibacteraceae bacterium]MBR6686865.1 biopolymer transporter ExbD [Paludibacteraceae bacterium]